MQNQKATLFLSLCNNNDPHIFYIKVSQLYCVNELYYSEFTMYDLTFKSTVLPNYKIVIHVFNLFFSVHFFIVNRCIYWKILLKLYNLSLALFGVYVEFTYLEKIVFEKYSRLDKYNAEIKYMNIHFTI